MRKRYIWVKERREFVPIEEFRQPAVDKNVNVIGDIPEYYAVGTGEWVGGRRQHREMLRRHGLEEVGNEKLDKPKTIPDVPGLRDDIRKTWSEMS